MTADVTTPPCMAQFGEDRVLERMFRGVRTGYYIEVGAYDGVELSSTYYFEQIGWQGILVEPIPDLCRVAAKARPRSRVVHAACGRPDQRGTARFTVCEGLPLLSFLKNDPAHTHRCLIEGATLVKTDVPLRTLDDIIDTERRDPLSGTGPWDPLSGWQIDFVSIDVESGELDVLDGFDLDRFRPKVLVIESDRASGASVEPYLKNRGYRKVHRERVYDFYVREDAPPDELALEGLNASSGSDDSGISIRLSDVAAVSDRCVMNHRLKTGATRASRAAQDSDTLLVLLNSGDFTRHYLIDMMRAAERLGIRTLGYEIRNEWAELNAGRSLDWKGFIRELGERRICAVLSSGMDGSWEWPSITSGDGTRKPFFETVGIPHICWWTDHPQWAVEKLGLAECMQPFLRSPNSHHFVKSELAADEVRDVLGWANTYGLPVAESAETLTPARDVTPEYDVVAIIGSQPCLSAEIAPFLDSDAPDVALIEAHVARDVDRRLEEVWTKHAPESHHGMLRRLGRDWIESRLSKPRLGAYQDFKRIAADHADAAAWLCAHPLAYFDAVGAMWEFGNWQRTFVIAYLARHFKVGVFGSDWSSMRLGKTQRVMHVDQPGVYAKGRIAINISQGNDEESITHKPFQIAACGVAMLHMDQPGLSECFTPGVEIETFATPREAREKVSALLADPDSRMELAARARARLCRDHTWIERLPQMLAAAGVQLPMNTSRDSRRRQNTPTGDSHAQQTLAR